MNEQVNLTLIFYIKLKKLHKSLDIQKDIKTNRMNYIIVIHTRNVSCGSLYKSAPILLREAIELSVHHLYLYYICMDL